LIMSIERFRALLTCTVCGRVVITGAWTTGDRALAAYNLGRSPSGAARVREHLKRVTASDVEHAVTVTFETGAPIAGEGETYRWCCQSAGCEDLRLTLEVRSADHASALKVHDLCPRCGEVLRMRIEGN
jgi:predicted RNA-binding Zn-ribbon protein involved in translation (DUF1610 family)